MIYIENGAQGQDGFTVHLLCYTFAISFSNFLGRSFYFDYEIPCSTPPDYATRPEFKGKFGILTESPRSLISQIVDMPADRVFEIDREVANKAEFQLLSSHFATTEEMRARYKQTAIWDFFGNGRVDLSREELNQYDLLEWTHTNLSNPSFFYFLPREEKRELMRSVEIRFISEIEQLASEIISQVGEYYAVHFRLGDFLTNYADHEEYAIDVERFTKYVAANFPDRSKPVLIATDALYEREMFATIFAGYKTTFVDELILGNFRVGFEDLPFTDFGPLVALNELIASAADLFIGTYRSTFTAVIHRMRQERYQRKDFHFFPDRRVATLLNDKMQIVPDRSGFFDWNRYSVFAQDHKSMGWRREWDFDLTSLPS